MWHHFQRIAIPVAATLMLFLPRLEAGLRPSFNLDGSAWHSTDIVLVQTTAVDGVFTVKESWKGDLKPGDPVSVPQLKPDSDAAPILRYPEGEPFDRTDEHGLTGRIPRQPAASLMILFLRRPPQEGFTVNPNSNSVWEASSFAGSIKTSVLWIDGDEVFCFRQWTNPGPSSLAPCFQGEAQVPWARTRVAHVLKIQSELANSLRVEDSNARAAQLRAIAYRDSYDASMEAIEGLGECGAAAVPTMLEIMDVPPEPDDARGMVKALINAAGENAGSVLNDRLKEDLAYWKAKGPSLSRNWLNQDPTPTAPLRIKYSETIEIIRGLSMVRYIPALQPATELRDLWLSCPQLNDLSRLNQLAEESDQLVHDLQPK